MWAGGLEFPAHMTEDGDMTTTHETTCRILLSSNFRATAMDGYDPTVTYRAVYEFAVAGEGEGAAEVVFAVANSYPVEMHCPERYAADVAAYRDAENRSLSTGDVVQVGEEFYSVDRFGFTRLDGSPRIGR